MNPHHPPNPTHFTKQHPKQTVSMRTTVQLHSSTPATTAVDSRGWGTQKYKYFKIQPKWWENVNGVVFRQAWSWGQPGRCLGLYSMDQGGCHPTSEEEKRYFWLRKIFQGIFKVFIMSLYQNVKCQSHALTHFFFIIVTVVFILQECLNFVISHSSHLVEVAMT